MSNLFLCPDDFWRCPIDINHQVLAKRFQYHILRCMNANPHIRRVRCVFNANHLTTPKDLLAHMSTCPDAINTSTVLIGLSDMSINRPWSDNCQRSSKPTAWQMFHDVNATEDWDDDIRERRSKSNEINLNYQINEFSSIETTTVQTSVAEDLHEKQKEDTIYYINKHNYVNDANQIEKKNYQSLIINKQALVFEEPINDGQIHPVETDELTKNLMKIRTLQLIGGAGRGACCLLHTIPPLRDHRTSKKS